MEAEQDPPEYDWLNVVPKVWNPVGKDEQGNEQERANFWDFGAFIACLCDSHVAR